MLPFDVEDPAAEVEGLQARHLLAQARQEAQQTRRQHGVLIDRRKSVRDLLTVIYVVRPELFKLNKVRNNSNFFLISEIFQDIFYQ